MRLRNIPGAKEAVMESELSITNPAEHKGNWDKVFGNSNPIHMEIGMGKGRFITELAKLNPDINYIGVERYESVLIKALERLEGEELPKNLRILAMDALELLDVFEPGEVKHIYLNFSDPWPKKRHAKRRLTSERFLPMYAKLLGVGGKVAFKTDNRGLFDYSLESFKENGWKLLAFTYDLHNDEELNAGNVMTEYEIRFSKKGNPINKLIAEVLPDTPCIQE